MIAITARQMKKVDELAVGKFGITIDQMMELAGFHLATLTRTILSGTVKKKKVVVLAGKGNNGGGGLVASRFLHNWGADVTVILSQKTGQKETVIARYLTAKALNITVRVFNHEMNLDPILGNAELIIDALVGYNLQGNPHSPISELIIWANTSQRRILSLDLPSGLDATNGTVHTPCIKAADTLTLAKPKKGLLVETAREHVGTLYLADIGIPPLIYRELNIESEDSLSKSNILKIREKSH